MTLRGSLAPILNNLSGHEPGKSAYLLVGLGTVTRCHICHAPVSPLTFTPPNTGLFSLTTEDLREQSASPFPKPFPFALNISNQQCGGSGPGKMGWV